MMYQSGQMEETAVLQIAAGMCAAARTAPKATGKDVIETLVLTGEDKEKVAACMRAIGCREFGENPNKWYGRDADNVSSADALVLIGAHRTYRGVAYCSFCGFADCGACREAGGVCAFVNMDLGIALSSAAGLAADMRADSRIMFSAGKAAMELGLGEPDVLWQGIPISIRGKNIFFDRKVK